ncbi:MAG TPA: DUF6252 family protein [Gemmatimonadaceae bacterium]|nr:DUF6252 family protein [Gemmatimonadaceae bacterium]
MTLAACDQSPLVPRIMPPVQPNGSFTATIDGAAWKAGGRVGVARGDTSLTLIALSRTYAISIGIGAAAGPGTYAVGDSSLVQVSVHQIGGQPGAMDYRGGTGTFSITMLTDSRIAGTFSFVAMPSPAGETGPLHVTSGAFDLTY